MRRQVFNLRAAHVLMPPGVLHLPSAEKQAHAHESEQEHQVKVSILHELEVVVIISFVIGARELEFALVRAHPGLEFHSVLRGHEFGFGLVVIKLVNSGGVVEVARIRKSFTSVAASQSVSALNRETSVVVTQEIHVVFFSRFSQLSLSPGSESSLLRSWLRNVASFVSLSCLNIHIFLQLHLGFGELVAVALSGKVIGNSRFSNREDLISLGDVSELIHVRLVVLGGGNIRMVAFRHASVSCLDFLAS